MDPGFSAFLSEGMMTLATKSNEDGKSKARNPDEPPDLLQNEVV
jgi:hypothetical protein